MKFIVPLHCDSKKQPMGLFAVHTSEGPVVVIFSNKPKWDRFCRAVAPVLAREGTYIGSTNFESDFIEDVVDQLAALDATITSTTFVPDSAPILASVMEFFEQQHP